MTEYSTQFSLIVPWPPDARRAIIDGLRAYEAREGWHPCEFTDTPEGLHLYALTNCLVDEVAAILATVQRTFRCPPIGIEYAMTCSVNEPEAFGGGAVAIRNGRIRQWGTSQWLARQLTPTPQARRQPATGQPRR
jgi:hypothetical protein